MMGRKKANTLWRLLKLAHRWRAVYLAGIIGVSAQSLAFIYVMASALRGLTNAAVNQDQGLLKETLVSLGLQLLLLTALLPLLNYAFEGTVKRMTGRLRKELFARLQRLPMAYMDGYHSGDMLSRVTNDVQAAESAYGWQLSLLLMAVIAGVGAAVVIFSVDAMLALAAVLIGLCNLLANTLFIKPMRRISDRLQEQLSGANQRLSDIIAGEKIIKIYNLAERLMRKYMEASLGIRTSAMTRTVYQSALNSINWFVAMMSFIGMIIIGSLRIIRGEMEFGQVLMVVQMMNGITWMFSDLGSFLAQLQGSLAGADRVFEILDAPVETDQPIMDAGDVTTERSPVLSFDNVQFAYEEGGPVLHGFSAVIPARQTAAVAGLSGSGKSTLLKLLLGFYKPQGGIIRIFGRDIRSYSLEALRRLIAYVPQDSYLFTGSIMENIAYGRLDASRDEIIGAAKAAYAHEFIEELPQGYDTQAGERGTRLSGGQRQRIAIARALLKDAPILLLDEATASLDSDSEQKVQWALRTLMEGRTTIVVAHRLSTIQNADRIFVMEEGRVAEAGVHGELMALNKTYAGLYRMQFQEV